MLNIKKTDLGKQSYSFDVTIPKADVQKRYDDAFNTLSKTLEVDGFRKGNVPSNIAKKHIKKESVYQKIAELLVSDTYTELIRGENLKPITSPRIELVSADEKADWVVRFTVAEKPTIDLKNYKTSITAFKAEAKKADIWLPGQEEKKPDAEKIAQQESELINKLISHLVGTIPVEIADVVIEDAVNKRLSQLVDDVQKIGLTMDSYLASKGETVDSIKAKYRDDILSNLKIDVILDAIATEEKITVEAADFEVFFSQIKDKKAHDDAVKNAYYYAPMIRVRKTLDYLKSL